MNTSDEDENTPKLQIISNPEIEHQVFIALAENSSEFFGISDLELKPVYVNAAGLRLVGLDDLEAAKAVSVADFFFPEDREFISGEFFDEVQRAGSGETEIRFRHFKTGRAVWMIYTVFIVKDRNGAAVGYGTISRDITERRKIEEALSESERRYRNLFGSIDEAELSEKNPEIFELSRQLSVQTRYFEAILSSISDFAYVFDREGRFVFINQALLDLWGLKSEEAIGKNFFDLKYPDDLASRLQKQIEEVFETKSRVTDETQYTSPTGVVGYYEYIFSPFFGADGDPELVVGTTRDITRRRQAEETIRRLGDRNLEIIESITDGFFAVDENWRFTYVNKQAGDILDQVPEELIGKSIWEIYPGLVGSEFERVYRRAAEEGTTEMLTSYYPDHDRYYEVNVYPAPKGITVYFRNATNRIRSEVKLRESEEHLRHTVELNPQIPWTATPDGKIESFSESWLELTGMTRENALGSGWTKAPHEDDLPAIEKAWRNAFKNGEPFDVEHRVRLKDGDYRWMRSRAFPRRDESGEIIRWYGTTEDIHERKSVEDHLKLIQTETDRERRLYDTILSNALDLVYVFDLDHRFSYANEVLLKMWGKTWDEAIGKNCLELGYEPWHAEMHDREIEQVKTTKKPIRGVVPFTGTFGRRIYDYIFVPIFGADGEVEAVAGVTRDITELKQIEIRNRFIMEVDEAVRPLETPEEITQTLARLLGEYLDADRCAYAEVEGDEDHFYIPGDFTKGDMHSIVGRYAMSDFGAEVLRLMREDKPYVVNDVDNDPQVTTEDLAAYRLTAIKAVICVPLHKNGRFAACMAVHQRVPRRWTDEEIELVHFVANRFWESIERARIVKSLNDSLTREQEARQNAEAANRVKDEFLATLSHELRTPLNAILGWSTLLRTGKLDSADSARALETVERSARAQSQLIEDLLDISRIITGRLRLEVKNLYLSNVITAAVEAVRPAAEAKEIRLQMMLDTETGMISGDAGRLQQVVWNLVSNAVKFTPRGGRVQIKLERVNSHIEIAVSDTGKGIEPEFLPYIFDRFRQADQSTTRRQGGLGLGLSIVRQLVEMHGGTVHAESEGEGTGTSVIISLPRLIALQRGENDDLSHVETDREAESQIDSKAELNHLKILIVDDETDSRELLRAVLEQQSADVTTAASAAEALKHLETENFDILVSDIGMPYQDGYELIGKVRKMPFDKNGRLPAIALTAYARVEDRVRALNAGFQAHIPKPVEPIELIAVIASFTKNLDKN